MNIADFDIDFRFVRDGSGKRDLIELGIGCRLSAPHTENDDYHCDCVNEYIPKETTDPVFLHIGFKLAPNEDAGDNYAYYIFTGTQNECMAALNEVFN
jgi:hypothetical protein